MTKAKAGPASRAGKAAGDDPRPAAFDTAALNAVLAVTNPQDPQALRDAVAALYAAIAAVPQRRLQDFETIREAELFGSLAREQQVGRGQIAIGDGLDHRSTLVDAARLLRALESHLSEFSHFLESDRGEDLEAAWRTSDGSHYVIPRVTPLAPVEGRAFLRRALRHHRVLPAHSDGFRVRLHRLPLVADAAGAEAERAGSERRYGAAWFAGLNVAPVSVDEATFLIERVEGFDAPAAIDAHLDQARAESCCALVWGELTMPATSVAHVSARLAATALDGPGSLHYLVAGSWHRAVGGVMRNVASVVDGTGEPLFEVHKWAKFKIDGKREAIEPGDEIHVLIAENEIIGFAICRDFLQETGELPYRRLGVDLMIVPSMTGTVPDPDTMHGHAATAQTMRVRYGTRTLVVAQPALAADGPLLGEVMAFPAKPLNGGSETVDQPFRVCPLETR